MADERVFTSAREVWEDFVDRTEIQPQTYDRDLTDAIRRHLGIPQTGADLSSDLEQHAISLERFIIALLEVGEPFSIMTSDLCSLLERHAIRKGSDVMHLRFDFAAADGRRLSFGIDHFRSWLRTWERVREITHFHKWTYGELWSLAGILKSAADTLRAPKVADPAALAWIAISRQPPQDRPIFRTPMPVPPLDALSRDARACVRVVADLVNDVVAIEAQLDDDGAPTSAPPLLTSELPGGAQPSHRFPGAFVRLLESDYFTAQVAEAIWRWAQTLRSLPLDERQEAAAPVTAAIRDLLGRLEVTTVDRQTLLRERLEEVLSLPIWKLRSNLYSAWLITLAERAFPDAEMLLHGANGVLNLSLSSEIATFTRGDQRFTMMSEHRVVLSNPIGDSRVSGAQPDYTLQPSSKSDPSEAYAVLEAKQYRRATTANFRDAAVDYANAHVNAKVIIADYGPLSGKIAQKIRAGYEDRVEAYGDVHPGYLANMQQVQRSLYSAVPRRLHLSDQSQFLYEDVRYIAIDVSGSMLEALRTPEIVEAIRNLVALHPEAEILAVDNGLRLCERGNGALDRVLKYVKSGTTDLQHALLDIPFSHLLVITDDEGATQLKSEGASPLGIATVEDGRLAWRDRNAEQNASA